MRTEAEYSQHEIDATVNFIVFCNYVMSDMLSKMGITSTPLLHQHNICIFIFPT